MRITSAKKPDPELALIVCQEGPGWADLPAALQQSLGDALERQPVACRASLELIPQPLVVAVKGPPRATPLAWRRLAGQAAMQLTAERATGASWWLPEAADRTACAAGFAQGAYRFDRYRPQAQACLKQLRLIGGGLPRAAARLADHLDLCRDLVNTPTEDMGPEQFVQQARTACRGTGLRLRVLEEAACRKAGMGCLTGVGRAAAADRRPRLLCIDWPGTGAKTKKFLALCGKGVCFDTGGLQIKPGKSMELMRKDMGGAATVLAAMIGIASDRVARPVRAYLPLVENAIAGDAFRPGDVLTAMDGTTVEVGHTDAEGRLILADAICLARKEKAAAVVTVATLTGAALVALGRLHVPLMGTDEQLLPAIETAAADTGERVWRLPLEDDHRRMVRSTIATITNSAGPEAACITAGAFLAHFAKQTPFAHCDISPASWIPGDHELGQAGATGVLVTSLIELARRWRR